MKDAFLAGYGLATVLLAISWVTLIVRLYRRNRRRQL